MKTVYFIYDKREAGQEKHNHVVIGINKQDLRSAVSRMHLRVEDYEREVLCNEETYNYIVARLIFGVFELSEIHKIEMSDMHFYKEAVMF